MQLIESPIFIHLRLQLLEPSRYPFLIKALYGLLMLLPQSGAFASLKVRLESVSSLQSLNAPESEFAASSKPSRFFGSNKKGGASNFKAEKPRKETEALNFGLMLDQFVQTQVSCLTQVLLLNQSCNVFLLSASPHIAGSAPKTHAKRVQVSQSSQTIVLQVLEK